MKRQKDYIKAVQAKLPEGWTKRDIRAFLVAQAEAAEECLSQGPSWDRAIVVPGLVKIWAAHVSAKPGRRARNPATGALMRLPAEPARLKTRVRLLLRMKRAVTSLKRNPPRGSVTAMPPAVVVPKRKDRYHREPVI